MNIALTRNELIVGSLHCAVHASQLIADAAALYGTGRFSSSFLLAVTAREELGKHYILLKQADSTAPGAGIDVATVQRAICPKNSPHQAKLAAGQSTFYTSAPLPTETYSERKSRFEKMREVDSNALHRERMSAQYIDLKDDGTWSLPINLSEEAAYSLILTVAYEVADPLRWVIDNPDASALVRTLAQPMQNAEEFLREIELLSLRQSGA